MHTVVGQIKNLDHIIQVLFLSMVGPITSEQIALSFGNSIIIAGVRAKTMTQPSIFYNTQLASQTVTFP